MKNIFDNCLVKEKYTYNLENASLSKMTGILNLTVKSNFIISDEEVKRAIDNLNGSIPGVSQVEIDLVYEKMIDDTFELAKKFLLNIHSFFRKEEVFMSKILSASEITFENDEVVIHVIGDRNAERLERELSKKLSNKFFAVFGVKCNFKFVCHEENSSRAIDKIKNTEDESFVRTPQREANIKVNHASNHQKRNREYSKSNRYGRNKTILRDDIQEDILPMVEFSETSGDCTVTGEIFGITAKDIGNDKMIITALLSDGTTSICAKTFLKKEQWDELKPILSYGKFVKIKGRGEFDSFSNSPVLRIQNIAPGEHIHRMDNAEKKRVELHAHTKMSSLDGLADVKSFINQAKSWGHKAVAITDHGVVQAFPDAARAAGDEIKIIYGMEGYLLDDKDLIMEDGSIDYKIEIKKLIIL